MLQLAFIPFHFSGWWQGKDILDAYPDGAHPIVRGEAVKKISENKEIFDLKKKCKVVQDKISRVVEKIPVGNIEIIELNLKKDSLQDNKERNKENDLPGNMHR